MRIVLGFAAVSTALLGSLWREARAEALRAPGGPVYLNASACVSAGKQSAQICEYAQRNAAAEFEEKAPRFASRAACEKALQLPCSIGFKGSGPISGRKDSVYFTARSQGFRIIETPGRDATVVPVAGSLAFQPRSARRLDVSISPQASKYWDWSARGADSGGGFGVSSPVGEKGAVPPPPPADPNFDCAAVLEPSARGSASTGCAPAPARKR